MAAEVYELEKQVKSHAYQAVTLTLPPPQYPLPDQTMTGLIPLAGDANRLEFLYQLMVMVGLLQPGNPVTVWPEVKEQFLRQPVAIQQAILSRAYFAMTNWSELWLLLRSDPDLHLVRNTYLHNTMHHPQSLSTELAAFRALVLTTLNRLLLHDNPVRTSAFRRELVRAGLVTFPRPAQGANGVLSKPAAFICCGCCFRASNSSPRKAASLSARRPI